MVSLELKKFLDFINENRIIYESAVQEMKVEDKRLQDFLHAIEFGTTAKERSKICTKLHKSRIARRKYKDIVEEREELIKFFADPQHKKTLDQLTQVLGKIRKVEKYHKDRVYCPRVKEE